MPLLPFTIARRLWHTWLDSLWWLHGLSNDLQQHQRDQMTQQAALRHYRALARTGEHDG